MITCDEIIESYNEEIKTVPTNLNKKNPTWQTKKNCFTCSFLITIALLLTVSTYSYLIKYNVKQKHLTLYIINNKLEEVMH